MINGSLIKWLHQNGYRQKLIQIITGYKQPTISKIVNSKRPIIPSIDAINNEQEIRKYVVDRILELRPLPTQGFTDQDKCYIKLLDYCLVDKEKIRSLYYNVTQYKVAQTLRSHKIKKEDFHPQLIGLTDEEYKYFLDKANF